MEYHGTAFLQMPGEHPSSRIFLAPKAPHKSRKSWPRLGLGSICCPPSFGKAAAGAENARDGGGYMGLLTPGDLRFIVFQSMYIYLVLSVSSALPHNGALALVDEVSVICNVCKKRCRFVIDFLTWFLPLFVQDVQGNWYRSACVHSKSPKNKASPHLQPPKNIRNPPTIKPKSIPTQTQNSNPIPSNLENVLP